MRELADALEGLDQDRSIACIVIAGSDDVFAAGADVGWLAQRDHEQMMWFSSGDWPRIRSVSTPTIAAVSGWALGGGCELALSCDMIVASVTARFGQPEIGLGILPGGGGTQRLARLVGRQRAMELILTGRRFGAEEAVAMGLVSRLAEAHNWLESALELAAEIASKPPLGVRLARQAIRAAEDMPFEAGLAHERRLFELAFATADRVEGMNAFLEKRSPQFPSFEGVDNE